MNIPKKFISFFLVGVLALNAFLMAFPFGANTVAAAETSGSDQFSGSISLETTGWFHNTPRFYVTTSSGYTTDGYCVEPAKTLPNGATFDAQYISAVTDEIVRNILYYGYNGPGMNTVSPAFSTGNSGYEKTPKGAMQYFRNRDNLADGLSETAYFYSFTHYAAAYAMYGSDVAFGVNPGYEEYTYKKAVTSYVNAIRSGIQSGSLTNRTDSLRVYLIHVSDNRQNIIFPVYRMRLELNKASLNPGFTDNNSAYSLYDAQFVAFKNNQAAANVAVTQPQNTDARKEGALTKNGQLSYIYTKDDGKGYFKNFGYGNEDKDFAIVDIANYCVIEFKSPAGYEINNNVYGYVDSGRIDENGFPIYQVDTSFQNKNGTPSIPNTPKMVLKMTKRSSDETITSGNSCYSLNGAVYGIFTDQNCTQPLFDGASIITDANGNGSYLDGEPIDGQELWAKETQASPGYALDTTIHKFEFSGKCDNDGYPIYTFTSTEKPENDPITVLLQKYDATTGKGTNTEKLANAEFTVKFYPAYLNSIDEIGDTQPLRTWVFKTNSNGRINYSPNYLVSGDDFWYDEGYPTIPFGTITVQETKAPNGYQLNPSVYLANINENSGNISWRTTNENIDEGVLQFPETQDNGGLEIYKTATDNKVEGIWFRVSTNGYSKDFCTDKSGLIVNSELSSLPVNKEYVVEELGFKRADGSYYYPKRYGQKPAPKTVRLESGKTSSVSFTNTVVLSDLNVIKESDDNNNKGVYFKLVSSKKSDYPLLVTNETGVANVANLPIYDDDDNLIQYTVEELGFRTGNNTYYIPDRYQKPQPQVFTLVNEDTPIMNHMIKSVMFHNTLLYGYAKVIKTDKDTGKSLAGCTFGLYSNKKCTADYCLDTCVTNGSGIGTFTKKQVVGTYYIKETACPPGYVLIPDVKTIKITASNQTEASAAVFQAANSPTETHISKTDITGTNEIAGATLTVAAVDNLSTIVDEWVSETSAHVIKGLEKGKSYVLTEKIPADGYVTANSITFTVNADGSTTKVIMKDDITKIEIIKVNPDNQAIAGVELQVIDNDSGKVVVPTWKTDGTPYRIDGKLVVGKTYRLHEVSTLPQYILGEDVSFTVSDTPDVQTVTMTNHFKTGSVTLHKRDGEGQNLTGSQWRLFTKDGKPVTVNMLSGGAYRYSDNGLIQIIDTDSNGDFFVDNMPFGDYYFVEVAAPQGKTPYAEKIPFTISGENANSLHVALTVKDNEAILFNTGSFGVKPFYIIGAVGLAAIIAGLGAYLIIKKKKSIRSGVKSNEKND